MQILTIKVVEKGNEEPVDGFTGEFTELGFTHMLVYPDGTVSGKTAVGFVIKDKDGNQFHAQMTAEMLHFCAGFVKGHDQYIEEQKAKKN